MDQFRTKEGSVARAAAGWLCRQLGVEDKGFESSMREHCFDGFTPMELAKECLRDAGQRVDSSNQMETLNRAMTTSDFPHLLGDVVNKVLETTYAFAPASFDSWAAKESVLNFKQNDYVRLSPPSDLAEVLEGAEYPYLDIKEGVETFAIKTYGGILRITRQTLINDDLSALKNMARILAQTAKMTQNRKTYSRLLSNPKLSDGLDVFAGARGNLLSGADSALSRDSLAAAVKTVRMMSDDAGNPLGVEPKLLLVPPSLEITAHELCFSDSMPGQTNSAVPNVFKKIGIEPVVDPLLEYATLGGTATNWFLFPDPEFYPVFMAVGLGEEGSYAPYVASQPGWKNDAVEYKVRIDFEAVAVGNKAVKSAGQ